MQSPHYTISNWVRKRHLIASLLLGAALALLIPLASSVFTPTPTSTFSTLIYGSLGTLENRVYCSGDLTTTVIASRVALEFKDAEDVLWPPHTSWTDYDAPDVPYWAAAALRDPTAAKNVIVDARGWPFRALRTSLSSLPSDGIVLPFRPILPGLLADTAIYALVVFILGMLVNIVRRCLRFEQGRCPTCAYDRRGQYEQECTECGDDHLRHKR